MLGREGGAGALRRSREGLGSPGQWWWGDGGRAAPGLGEGASPLSPCEKVALWDPWLGLGTRALLWLLRVRQEGARGLSGKQHWRQPRRGTFLWHVNSLMWLIHALDSLAHSHQGGWGACAAVHGSSYGAQRLAHPDADSPSNPLPLAPTHLQSYPGHRSSLAVHSRPRGFQPGHTHLRHMALAPSCPVCTASTRAPARCGISGPPPLTTLLVVSRGHSYSPGRRAQW